MQGTTAQIVALAIEGNAFLRGVPSAGLTLSNSTCSFCEYVRFVDVEPTPGGWSESLVAETPEAWFKYLKSQYCHFIRVLHLPSPDSGMEGVKMHERMMAGFIGGGGRRVLAATLPGSVDIWEARWTVGNSEDPEQRIWRVTYGRIAKDQLNPPFTPENLPAVKRDLRSVLEKLHAFATRQKLDSFADCFSRSLEDLESPSPVRGCQEFLNRAMLPLEAIQLLSAAQAAWVFGGMGSWNDLGFEGEDQATYIALSDELYDLVNKAIAGATNMSSLPLTPAARPTVSERDEHKPWWQIF